MEEYVLDFIKKNSLTPIEIVQEITGLSYEEIIKAKEFEVIKVYDADIDI